MDTPLDSKIGQMIMVGFRGTSVTPGDPIVDAIRSNRVGAVWLCDYVSPTGERLGNIASPAQLAQLIATLKGHAESPLLVALDAEGGRVIRLKTEYGFPPTPSAEELGAADDLEVTASAASAPPSTVSPQPRDSLTATHSQCHPARPVAPSLS